MNERESLPELIETRAAQHGISQRKLWQWVFAAILDGTLAPSAPSVFSLDAPFDHGGMPLTWRRVIATQTRAIGQAGVNPSDWSWTGNLVFSIRAFDTWLKGALQNHRIPERPKRRAGGKRTLRDAVAAYAEKHHIKELPPGMSYKQIANDMKTEAGLDISERTVRRAFGRK